MINTRISKLLIIVLTAIAVAACTASENLMSPNDGNPELVVLKEKAKKERELRQILASTRSKLSDVYLTQQHDMPKPFLRKDTTDVVQRDPFDGFRIQIISTRNVDLADSVKLQFSMWADTTISGYSPKAYIFFKQPYFKVHVGDFHDRNMANEVSKMIKRKYPEAWVVHDRIDPNLVPADSTQIDWAANEESSDTTSYR